MRKILVIGGSYFAGRVFVEELAKEEGVEIHLFNRGRVPLGMPGVHEHVGDRDEPGRIVDAIPAEDWDAVVDFCAYDEQQIDRLLLNLPGRLRHYIFISTTSVYARTTFLPIDEGAATVSGPQEGLGKFGDYASGKMRAEQRVEEYCRRQEIPYTILRPAIIYGYYNYAPRESYFFDLLRRRQPIVLPENGLALYSFIFVVDMARMLIRCLGNEQAFGETFNLAADELISYDRIVDVLSEITGKTIEPVRASLARLEREAVALPFPPDDHLIYSGAKAKALFDVPYTPFKIGMRETLKYWLAVQKATAAG